MNKSEVIQELQDAMNKIDIWNHAAKTPWEIEQNLEVRVKNFIDKNGNVGIKFIVVEASNDE